jgi:hypothetical protein
MALFMHLVLYAGYASGYFQTLAVPAWMHALAWPSTILLQALNLCRDAGSYPLPAAYRYLVCDATLGFRWAPASLQPYLNLEALWFYYTPMLMLTHVTLLLTRAKRLEVLNVHLGARQADGGGGATGARRGGGSRGGVGVLC